MIQAVGKLRQKTHESKVNLDYEAKERPDWATLKKKEKEKKILSLETGNSKIKQTKFSKGGDNSNEHLFSLASFWAFL